MTTRPSNRTAPKGHVTLVGAGPGDPELLTLKALRALEAADVVVHDRLVPAAILALCPANVHVVDAGKTGFGPSTPQSDIDAMLVDLARSGGRVVRLKAGDPGVFGRLDEELDALTAAGIPYTIVPGITAASAAVARIGQSLTKRGRNSAVRLITGHDTKGYAAQDWQALAAPGEVAAIYMGRKAARFIQGRLTMYGASPATPVTIIENASQPSERVHAATLATLADTMAAVTGPALTLFGLAPRAAVAVAQTMPLQEIAQ